MCIRDSVVGMQKAEARETLKKAGYKVEERTVSLTGESRGIVVGLDQPPLLLKGGTVTIRVADGTRRPTPPPAPSPRPDSTTNRPDPLPQFPRPNTPPAPSLRDLIPLLPF